MDKENIVENEQKESFIDVPALISPGGLLLEKIPGFEYRKEQVELLQAFITAMETNTHLISEAGTGTGKSLAYLLPSIYSMSPVIISTNTKALQDQLVEKDIPYLKEILDREFTFAIAKGKNNYLCDKRKASYVENLNDFTREEIDFLQDMPEGKCENDFPTIPFGLWQKICADDTCISKKCAFSAECGYIKSRQALMAANIIICNHHLLTCDLAVRVQTGLFDQSLVLPVASRLVIDEAHNFEDIMIKNFTRSISRLGIQKMLHHAYSEKTKTGVLPRLEDSLDSFSLLCSTGEMLKRLVDIQRLVVAADDDRLGPVFTYVRSFDKFTEVRYRVKESISNSPRWQAAVSSKLSSLAEELQTIALKLEFVLGDISEVKDEKDSDALLLFNELKKLHSSFSSSGSLAARFTNFTMDRDIRWIETFKENVKFNISPIDIATILKEIVYPHYSSVMYTSATLTVDKQFDHINKRLGLTYLPPESYRTAYFDSPFDYKKNSITFVPMIEADPNSANFASIISPWIKDIVLHLKGRTFILFTSFQMLNECHAKLYKDFAKAGIKCLSQSEHQKGAMIETFKKNENSVLFGTQTFWEGIDIKGEALQCVIIPRLPFQVPSEPIVDAKIEVLTAQGGNSFMDYMLPEAVIKLKQGFGRLIRSIEDTGSVWFFDNRLTKKGYGGKILRSLPETTIVKDTYSACFSKFKDFHDTHK